MYSVFDLDTTQNPRSKFRSLSFWSGTHSQAELHLGSSQRESTSRENNLFVLCLENCLIEDSSNRGIEKENPPPTESTLTEVVRRYLD